MEIKDIMRKPVLISDEETFLSALKKLICEKTNSALVVDKEGKLVGEVNVLQLLKEVIPDYLEGREIAAHFATLNIFHEDVPTDARRD